MPGEYPPEYRGGGLENYFRKLQGIDGIAKNVPQNAVGRMLADNLQGLRSWMDNTSISAEIPYTDIGGKMGLGEMFVAQAPEMVRDMSWGIPATQPTGHGRKLDPRMADILGLPLPYAGAGQVAKILGKKGLRGMMPKKSNLLPDDMSRRKFNKNMLGTGLATGAVVSGGLAGKAMMKGIAPDVARTTASAAAKIIPKLISTSEIPKLGYMLLNSSNPTAMLKALKEGGAEGLTKALNDVDGIDLEFPDYDNYAHNVDFDELETFIKDPDVMKQTFKPKDELLGHDEIESDFLMDILMDPKEPYGINDYLADYMDAGFDPVDVVENLKSYPHDIPGLKKASKFAAEYPDDFRRVTRENLYQNSLGTRMFYGPDGSPGSTNKALFLEPNYE